MAATVDPNVVLFAAWVKANEDKEREAKAAARESQRKADAENALVAAKDAAAAEVKRLRTSDKATAADRAAAEAAYRDALAAVVAAESGETIPAAQAEPTAAAEPNAETVDEDSEAESADEPEAAADSAAETNGETNEDGSSDSPA